MLERYNPFQERWETELALARSKIHNDGLGNPLSIYCSRQEFEQEQLRALKSVLNINSKDRVLEFGCGKSRVLSELCDVVDLCVGLDISREVLELNIIEGRNLTFVQGDIFRQPFADGSFDIVLSEGVIEHFNDWPKILKEAARVLKSGGQLVTAVPNILNLPQTFSLLLQGKKFRYYPEKPFYPGKLGVLAKEYETLGLTDLRFAGWCPSYFFDSFYLFDPETRKIKHPFYSPALRALGKGVKEIVDLLLLKHKNTVNRWFGYEFLIAGVKP